MDLREQIRTAIGGALAAQEGSDGAADAVMEVLARQQRPAAWCATDETKTVVEALGMNQSRRFDTALYLVPGAQPAPSVPTALLVAIADLVTQIEIIACVGFVDTPNDKDSCAAFCVAEGSWLELMSCVESLAAWLAAAPEAKS